MPATKAKRKKRPARVAVSVPEVIEAAKVGRPSKYEDTFAEEARRLCLLGLTNEQLAEHFGCSVATLYNWREEHPEFLEAIKEGREPADAGVASSLYQRARGAEWVEQQAIKLKTVKYEAGKRVLEEERVEVVDVIRRAPPDTTAGIFWLKNRRAKDWRDRQVIEGDPDAPLVVKVVRG